MLEQRIQQHFFDSADLKYQVAESLARPLAEASTAVLGGITTGGKVLAAGLGLSALAAQRLVAGLVGRFERERPALAAVTLSADSAVNAALQREGAGLLAAQVQALAAPGDVLVLFCADGPNEAARLTIAAAQDKDMIVVALVGRDAGSLRDMLQETDVLIRVPHDRAARVREVHDLAVHCLLDAVDVQLLGEQETA